jgi:rare lipoprotein A
MRTIGIRRTAAAIGLVLAACGSLPAQTSVDPNWSESGVASWYGPGFAGRPTASGEIYNPNHLTAAHKTLPLGTLVRVHNVESGRQMIVRINDRGPFVAGRVIDLSRAAAEVLGFRDDGLAQVELTVVQPPKTRSAGEALRDAVGRATRAVWQAPARGESHLAEAEPDSPALPAGERAHDTSPAPRNTRDDLEGFFVQVGAFRESLNAEELIRRLESLGITSRLRETGEVVRVLVGPFDEQAAARNVLHNLERAGIDGFLWTAER